MREPITISLTADEAEAAMLALRLAAARAEIDSLPGTARKFRRHADAIEENLYCTRIQAEVARVDRRNGNA